MLKRKKNSQTFRFRLVKQHEDKTFGASAGIEINILPYVKQLYPWLNNVKLYSKFFVQMNTTTFSIHQPV